MGVLTASGALSPDAAPGVQGKDPAPETEAKETKDNDFVPYSKIDGRAPEGRGPRRSQAVERQVADLLEARVKPLEDKFTSDRDTYERRIQEQSQEIARLQGQYQALQSRPAPAPAPAAPAPAPADPDALIAEAEGLLAKDDLRGYHKKMQQAQEVIADARADVKVAAVRKDLESRIPPQLPPEIQDLMSRHRNVAMSGQRGIQAVMLKDGELGLYGAQPGPQRMAKAFQLAEDMLEKMAKPTAPASFSKDSASALAGAPAQRSAPAAPAAAEPGYAPTDADKAVMRAMGWNAETFVKWKHPEKWIKR